MLPVSPQSLVNDISFSGKCLIPSAGFLRANSVAVDSLPCDRHCNCLPGHKCLLHTAGLDACKAPNGVGPCTDGNDCISGFCSLDGAGNSKCAAILFGDRCQFDEQCPFGVPCVVAPGKIFGFCSVALNFNTCGATGSDGPTSCPAGYPTAASAPSLFNLQPNGVQQFTVPSSGCYKITAVGVAGGSAFFGGTGGFGASLSARFQLSAGDVLDIVVGQKGESANQCGGGAGASMISMAASTSLVFLIAAGGGGAGSASGTSAGCSALVTTSPPSFGTSDRGASCVQSNLVAGADGTTVFSDIGPGKGYSSLLIDPSSFIGNTAFGGSDIEGGFGGGGWCTSFFNEGGGGAGYSGGSGAFLFNGGGAGGSGALGSALDLTSVSSVSSSLTATDGSVIVEFFDTTC
ncbi:MAG: hypothetical protein MHM6MM_002793 [Cercozoa sp. M6MM]